MAALDSPGWCVLGFGLSGRAASHLLALTVLLGRDSRALGVVCPSFGLFVVLGLGDWCLEGCGVLAPLPPCARALLSPSTLEGKVWWLPLTGFSWIPYTFGSVSFVASPSFLGTIPQAYLLLMSLNVAKCNLG